MTEVTLAAEEIRDRLRVVLGKADGFAELRYHCRTSRAISVRRGEVHDLSSGRYEGVGVRVLEGGAWGFASTSDLSLDGLTRALAEAGVMARELRSRQRRAVELTAPGRLAAGDFLVPGHDALRDMGMAQKLESALRAEERLRGASRKIESAICEYSEQFEDKIIMTTDGADVHVKLARPELALIAFGADGARRTLGAEAVGGTGSWQCLFVNQSLDEMIDSAARDAVALLDAPEARGGTRRVILSPAMVGLLSHEAIGHTVEADFVLSGSVAAGKIGEQVASELVTLCDSGSSEHRDGAGGVVPVDDEGVAAVRIEIIKAGVLTSYLHNRESAARFGVAPTGNARAWEFSDEPLIRMTNTYIEPGPHDLETMISEIEDGYLVDGPGGGQADATGEFMFGASRVHRIRDGVLAGRVQKLSVSGNAFEVLRSVDAVSQDFRWGLGSGCCGKVQPARVDAGGPYLRCELLIGGAQ